jgi:hypothetical protein
MENVENGAPDYNTPIGILRRTLELQPRERVAR